MRNRNRSGLTMLDVAVTIVILLILAALLIPSFSRQRYSGASRRSQCKNNLKQIGLALMNYHDVHRTFPPGWIVSAEQDRSSGFGWGYHLLPFFDQAPLFKKFDSHEKLSGEASGNTKLAATILTAMRCPSDEGKDQVNSRWMSDLGSSNYIGNFGIGIPTSYSRLAESKGNIADTRSVQGMQGANTRVRIRDVKDGMSNVILVGERRQSADGVEWPAGKIEGRFNSYWAGIPQVGAVSPLAIVATATGGEFEGSTRDEDGNWSALPLFGNVDAVASEKGRQKLTYFGINRDVQGKPLKTVESTTSVTAGFSSWHTGGCQVVLGDGTVRFLSENIDPIVFTNLMRRSDGKTLGEF